MKTHTCSRATVTPANARKMAGPKLLAGFTDVPVSPIPRRWTKVRLQPTATTIKYDGPAPMISPTSWNARYRAMAFVSILSSTRIAGETAGPIWHPGISPMRYAVATIARPDAEVVCDSG